MVGFGPIFELYYSQDICAQFELSKNVFGLVVLKPNYKKMFAKNLVKNNQEPPQ